MGENEIDLVQNFIKSKLTVILSNWKSREDGPQISEENFFGPIHVFNPSEFEFTPGDRCQINSVVAFVKKIVSDPNEGAQYFDPNKSKHIKISYKSIGEYFGHSSLPQVNRSAIADMSELKMKLFESAIKIMKKKGVSTRKVEQFSIDMVSITTRMDYVLGHIQCILCRSSDDKQETITVQSKVGEKSKLYWILSNFGKHLNTHDKKTNRRRVRSDSNEENDFSPFDENSVHITTSSMIKQYQTNAPDKKNDTDENENVHNNSTDSNSINNNHSMTSALSIEPTNDLEQLIYNQISEQLLRMNNAVLAHNESKTEMIFFIENVQHKLLQSEIEPDGNCIFGALVHQMRMYKISSNKQSQGTKKLRVDVVDHIKKYPERFEKELDGVVLNLWGREAHSNLQLARETFLNDELPKNGTWGGAETTKAVSQLNKVNILVINEKGDFQFACRFNTEFKRTVILSYTSINVEEHEVTDIDNESGNMNVSRISHIARNHYNSVIDIEQEDVFTLSKMLALNIRKQQEMIQNHNEKISIDDTI